MKIVLIGLLIALAAFILFGEALKQKAIVNLGQSNPQMICEDLNVLINS